MWPIAVTYGRTIPLFGVQLVVHQILCEWIHLTLKGLYYYHSTQISCPALSITGAVQVWPDHGGVFSILLHSTNMKLSKCNRALYRSKFHLTKWYSEYQIPIDSVRTTVKKLSGGYSWARFDVTIKSRSCQAGNFIRFTKYTVHRSELFALSLGTVIVNHIPYKKSNK